MTLNYKTLITPSLLFLPSLFPSLQHYLHHLLLIVIHSIYLVYPPINVGDGVISISKNRVDVPISFMYNVLNVKRGPKIVVELVHITYVKVCTWRYKVMIEVGDTVTMWDKNFMPYFEGSNDTNRGVVISINRGWYQVQAEDSPVGVTVNFRVNHLTKV